MQERKSSRIVSFQTKGFICLARHLLYKIDTNTHKNYLKFKSLSSTKFQAFRYVRYVVGLVIHDASKDCGTFFKNKAVLVLPGSYGRLTLEEKDGPKDTASQPKT